MVIMIVGGDEKPQTLEELAEEKAGKIIRHLDSSGHITIEPTYGTTCLGGTQEGVPNLHYTAANLDQHLPPIFEGLACVGIDDTLSQYETNQTKNGLGTILSEVRRLQIIKDHLHNVNGLGYNPVCDDEGLVETNWSASVDKLISVRIEQVKDLTNNYLDRVLEGVQEVPAAKREEKLDEVRGFMVTLDEPKSKIKPLFELSDSVKNAYGDGHSIQDLPTKHLNPKEPLGHHVYADKPLGKILKEVGGHFLCGSFFGAAVGAFSVSVYAFLGTTTLITGGASYNTIKNESKSRRESREKIDKYASWMNIDLTDEHKIEGPLNNSKSLQMEVKSRVRTALIGKEGQFVGMDDLISSAFPNGGRTDDNQGERDYNKQKDAIHYAAAVLKRDSKMNIETKGHRFMDRPQEAYRFIA